MAVAFSILVSLLFGYLSYRLAERRGSPTLVWSALGVAFGPLALLLLMIAPPRRSDDDRNASAAS
ncbi:hypothetical protein [Telmatospirillum sp.]|uniref:hypothetical protein n=1 Tax=Telmatospirillum sp. TaxID=2079197 RepID=UPI00283FDF15|nr:hypothetical protein [Telmatospirillum sp.]MDR3438437.1 hypothetical protein [Telmatospirillum sp.]